MKIPFEQVEKAISQGNIGFCLTCGWVYDGIEPDVSAYLCEEGCGFNTVYGAEEILIMGEVE